MYGCLDLAERIDVGTPLDTSKAFCGAPFLAVRGVYTFRHGFEAGRDWVYEPAFLAGIR
jgi:hypothetical protein